jgi:hypothetical protein
MESKIKESKYNCEKCNFKCNTKARWDVTNSINLDIS